MSFDEAITAFSDWLSTTIPDPDHSEGDQRFILLGQSNREENSGCLPLVSREDDSNHRDNGAQMLANEDDMKRAKGVEGMRPHYDFTGGVRGKDAAAYAKGTNVVVIAPDLTGIFPDSESVNEALRTLVRISGKTARITKSAKQRA